VAKLAEKNLEELKVIINGAGAAGNAIEAKANQITGEMKAAAAYALAHSVKKLTQDKILPGLLDDNVAENVSIAVKQSYES